MAWNTTNEGVPFHPLIAPETPAPSDTAARIISAGTGPAISGFVQMAIARERAQLEQQHQIQNADLQAKELAMRQEKMGQDHELGKRELDLKSKYYDVLATNAGTNATRAETAMTRLLQQNGDRAEFEDQVATLNSDVDTRAKELGLTNPELQTKNPIGFAAAVKKIKEEFPNPPLYTGIPDRFKGWQSIADQQQIPVKYGATYDSEGKSWKGGNEKMKPVWQVYRDLHNPDTQEATINALAAMGHLKTEPAGSVKIAGELKNAGLFERGRFSGDVPATSTTWDDVVSNIMKQGDKADWTPGVSRMPTFVPKSSRAQAAKFGDTVYDPLTTAAGRAGQPAVDEAVNSLGEESSLPSPDLPPDEPTQVDVLLEQARRAAAMPGANIEGIKGVLRQNNVDPDQL